MLFDPDDVAAADEDPFSLPLGRHNVTITESEEDSAEWDKEGEHFESRTWKITVNSQEHDKDMSTTFFLEGDEKAVARTNGNIKAMFRALAIPESDWGSIAENPAELIGYDAVVFVQKGKKSGRNFMKFVGVPKGTAVASSEPVKVSAGSDSKSNPFF